RVGISGRFLPDEAPPRRDGFSGKDTEKSGQRSLRFVFAPQRGIRSARPAISVMVRLSEPTNRRRPCHKTAKWNQPRWIRGRTARYRSSANQVTPPLTGP